MKPQSAQTSRARLSPSGTSRTKLCGRAAFGAPSEGREGEAGSDMRATVARGPAADKMALGTIGPDKMQANAGGRDT